MNGKCECGEADPNHTHNYEDGTCTICGEEQHEHNFVDGVCSCGEIDPNHTHNYEDGTCTICGKEQDPYELAPASAISNWNYTLDSTNDIITLNYYTGSETDVIVYANYIVNGETYKTQIKSNTNGNYTTKYMFNRYAQTNCKNIQSIIFTPVYNFLEK